MWPLDHCLERWFEEVKKKRDEKYGRNKTGSPVDSSDGELYGGENVYFERMKMDLKEQMRQGGVSD